MSDFSDLVKQLQKGECPAQLCYNTAATQEIDWGKVQYNTFYRSREFFEGKFPESFHTLPGFDKIIDVIVDKNKDNSPLKEFLMSQ